MILLIGESLGNRYEIKKLIGEGGMALVYLAKDRLLDRPVAIKVLRPEYSSDQEFVERFQREAKSSAKLCHPNIVNIYDVGQTGNTYYIVMEYVEGISLKDLIKREGMLPVDLSLKIAIQISSALQHAHNNLIVHRDIKPHNIMITNDYRVKVMDFGIARAISAASITRTGVVLGSVHYFSPEQATGKEVTKASDIYSLGIVLYEMLSGKVPFDADTPVGIAYQHAQAEIPSLVEKRPDLPKYVIDIVNKALAKEPKERFSSASSMEEQLKKALELTPKIQKVAFTKVKAKDSDLANSEKTENNDSTMIFSHTKAFASSERDNASMSKKDNKASPKKTLTVTLVLIGLLVLMPAYLFLKVSAFLNVPEVEVPSITGLSQDAAEKMLGTKNLGLEIDDEVYDSELPKGYVISQNPDAGRLVKEKRAVKVILSKGPDLIMVPELVGKDIRSGQVELEKAALQIGEREYVETEEYMPGVIISQSPGVGEEVEKGTKIDVQLSKAPLTRTFLMPDLVRQTRLEAELTLNRYGLVLGEVYPQYDNNLPEGYVIDHNPAHGSEIVEGTIVDLTVSARDNSSNNNIYPKNDDPTNTKPQIRGRKESEVRLFLIRSGLVRIVVIDETGSHEVYRKEHRDGDFIKQTVSGIGVNGESDVYVQVWLGTEIQKETVLLDVTQ